MNERVLNVAMKYKSSCLLYKKNFNFKLFSYLKVCYHNDLWLHKKNQNGDSDSRNISLVSAQINNENKNNNISDDKDLKSDGVKKMHRTKK